MQMRIAKAGKNRAVVRYGQSILDKSEMSRCEPQAIAEKTLIFHSLPSLVP